MDSCTFDRQNKRVTVRARTAQAGWQGQPVGNVQTFAIPVDTFENYVYKYNVKNNGRRGSIEITTGSGEAPTVNGVSVPRSATIPLGAEDAIYSSIGKFELNATLGGGSLSVNYYKLSFGEAVTLSRTTEGYLLIEREVVVTT